MLKYIQLIEIAKPPSIWICNPNVFNCGFKIRYYRFRIANPKGR